MIPALVVLYSIGLGWQVYKMRREIFYADHKTMETIAREVNQVTPGDGWVFAFEQVYFEARRLPPPGLENAFIRILAGTNGWRQTASRPSV